MSWENVLIILQGLHWTVGLTLGALALGAVLGFPIMLARVSHKIALRWFAIGYIAFVRAIPPIVWIFIVFFGIGSGALAMDPFLAALIAFGLIASANMAEVWRAGLIAVPAGQTEAANALNIDRWSRFTGIILPQLFRVSLPGASTYAIALLKDSAIASTIGVTELAFQGGYVAEMTYRQLPVLGIVAVIYILLSLPIAALSRNLDRKLRMKVAR